MLTIVEEGHDCEKWGGHFGSRFKNDYFYVTKYCKSNDWVAKIKTNFSAGITLPYTTYYNMGHGHYFYIKGSQIKKNYDFMSDYDYNLAYVMNPPIHTNIHYHDAFMGGTCLMVQ